MKILIAADMEGIPGVVNWDQVTPGHAEYSRFRRIMTESVNAAVRGVCEASANEVIVADGHAGALNILIEELDPRAHLYSGSPSPLAMVQGADSGLNGAMFIGYHARAGTKDAILDHTWSSKCVANVWLNELIVGETGLNAAVCGHYDVPVLMVSGDQAVCTEALELLGQIEVAPVKRATGRMSAECLPVPEAMQRICEAAARGVARLQTTGTSGTAVSLFRLPTPVYLAVELVSSEMADQASLFPGAKRLDGRRLELEAGDMLDAYRAFRSMVALARA
jgi:D-amino peptidase